MSNDKPSSSAETNRLRLTDKQTPLSHCPSPQFLHLWGG